MSVAQPFRFPKALPPMLTIPGPVQRIAVDSTDPLRLFTHRDFLTINQEWYRVVHVINDTEVEVRHLPSVLSENPNV